MDRLSCMHAFVKVVENRGFSAAARRMNVSPQAVSNLVHVLETRLGVRLLNRTTRKISLTDIGREYYDRCTQILLEVEEVDQIVNAARLTPVGRLRLNVNTSLAPVLAPVVAEFISNYPQVSIDLVATDRMVDLVEEGFDLSVRNTSMPSLSLIVRQLMSYRFLVCASPDYLRQHGTPRTPQELTDHVFLTFSPTPWGNEWTFKSPSGKQTIRVAGNLQSNNGDALRIAAVHGLGLIITPEFTVTEHLYSGRLVSILEDYPLPELYICAAYPHRRHLSAAVRSFLNLLARRCKDNSLYRPVRTALPLPLPELGVPAPTRIDRAGSDAPQSLTHQSRTSAARRAAFSSQR
jgi:DNA-binding transcriptional LysR family regulator